MKQISAEAVLSMMAIVIHAMAPVIFYAIWVALILYGQMLVKGVDTTRRKQFYIFVIGAPIGVLSALAIEDHYATSQYVAALAGCGVAIMAEQILNGNIVSRVFDALIGKINKT